MNLDPKEHDYVIHPTDTETDCAICGQPVSEHLSMLIERTMTRKEFTERYPELAKKLPCHSS